MVINKAKNIITDLNGVLKVEKLTNQDIVNLIDIESNKDNELIPVINEGMKECFRQDVSLVIFKKGFFRIPPSPTVILTNSNGQILGQEVLKKEDKEKFKKDENAIFLSDDFVIFKNNKDTKYQGKECFLLPPIAFPELEIIDEINTVVSSSPSTQSDEYLKEKYGYLDDGSVATIIVSFSF